MKKKKRIYKILTQGINDIKCFYFRDTNVFNRY